MSETDRAKVPLALGALYVIWGSTFLAIRLALEGGFPPMLLSGLRFVAAGTLLVAWQKARGAPWPTLGEWRASVMVGTLMVLANGFLSLGEERVASGAAAIMIASVPLWTALFTGVFEKWPGRGEWLGLAVGLLGVIVLQRGGFRASPLGALFLTLSCVTWALGALWTRRISLPKGLMSSGAQMLSGGIALTLFALGDGERIHHLPSAGAIAAWGYLVTFGSMIGYSAFQYLIARVRPTLATSYAYVNPVIAVFLGALIAGEAVAPAAIGALALILGGVALLAVQRGRATAR